MNEGYALLSLQRGPASDTQFKMTTCCDWMWLVQMKVFYSERQTFHTFHEEQIGDIMGSAFCFLVSSELMAFDGKELKIVGDFAISLT